MMIASRPRVPQRGAEHSRRITPIWRLFCGRWLGVKVLFSALTPFAGSLAMDAVTGGPGPLPGSMTTDAGTLPVGPDASAADGRALGLGAIRDVDAPWDGHTAQRLAADMMTLAAALNDYPNGALDSSKVDTPRPKVPAGGDESAPPRVHTGPRKQAARMRKCMCPDCGYTVRTTAKWLEHGLSRCPAGDEMQPEPPK